MAEKGLISKSTLQGFAEETRRLADSDATGTPAEILAMLQAVEGGMSLPAFVTEIEFAQVTGIGSKFKVPCGMSAAPTHYLIYVHNGTSGSSTSSSQFYSGFLARLLLPNIHTHVYRITSTGSTTSRKYSAGVSIDAASSSVSSELRTYTSQYSSFTLSNGVATLSDYTAVAGKTYNVIMWRYDGE